MAKYVYLCDECKNLVELEQSMKEDLPELLCGCCGHVMHRVPQRFTHYNSPWDTLGSIADKKLENYKRRIKNGRRFKSA